ncbi:MAG: site-specific integrase [Oscillospiraceae bacterium]|nr:site-specific integrase [Oscillospiraceae bacterium]
MKNRTPDFMELLETFFSEYMPYSAGLSKNTILSYKYAFRLLIEYLYSEKNIPADRITFKLLDFNTINAFLLWLKDKRKCSDTTRNMRLAAISSFAAYAQNRSLDAAAVLMNSVKKVPVKKQPSKPRTVFSLDEVAVLLRLPDCKTTTGARDNVMLNLMYASGARTQEICDLTVRDAQFQNDVTKLTITGKGEKMRRINIPQPCGDLLKQYLVRKGIQNNLDRHIFSSQTHEYMTISCIRALFKKYLNIAKAQNPSLFLSFGYSPHTMRHTTATHMLEAGIPMMAIKNFLGHASVMTTERYAELSQSSVNKHIREWNQRWFSPAETSAANTRAENKMPGFLQ